MAEYPPALEGVRAHRCAWFDPWDRQCEASDAWSGVSPRADSCSSHEFWSPSREVWRSLREVWCSPSEVWCSPREAWCSPREIWRSPHAARCSARASQCVALRTRGAATLFCANRG
jgi:hypothetical protein